MSQFRGVETGHALLVSHTNADQILLQSEEFLRNILQDGLVWVKDTVDEEVSSSAYHDLVALANHFLDLLRAALESLAEVQIHVVSPTLRVTGQYLPEVGLELHKLEGKELHFSQLWKRDAHESRDPLNRVKIIGH